VEASENQYMQDLRFSQESYNQLHAGFLLGICFNPEDYGFQWKA
jgi:hypothetical protein